MPQILPPDSADDTGSAEEQFLGLLLADDDLFQAEFDAQTPAGDVVAEPR
jgi:hypothetical protein